LLNSSRKDLNKLFLMLCVFSLNAIAAEPKIHINNDFYLQYNNITGNGKSQSSLTDGFRYYNMFNLYIKGKQQEFKYSFNVSLKATDDKRKDIKGLSLTNIQGMVTNKIHTLRVGDIFESFSQYSLSSALKGASYRYLSKNNLNQVQFIYGVAYPRWDSFWDNDTEATKRRVFGARYRRKVLNGKMSLGASFVHSSDSDRIFSGNTLYDNDLYTLDMDYRPIPGLNVHGEFSHSQNSRDMSDTTANIDYSGNAFKLRAIGNKNPSRVLLEYERVSPDFITLTGSATPDREKFKSTWRYKISKKVTTHLGFLWYRNDLDGQLTASKNVYRPSVGITYKKAFGRRHNVLNLTYKFDKTNTTNDITNHILDFSMNDRFGKIYNTTNMSYYKYKTDGATQDSHEFRINTQFSGRVSKKSYVLKPSLRLGTWSNRDELQSTLDKYYEASVGLGLDIPKYKVSSSFKIGENKANRDLSDDSKKVFTSLNIYYRPKRFFSFKRTMIYARAFLNDYAYTTGSKDFRENSVTAGIKIRF